MVFSRMASLRYSWFGKPESDKMRVFTSSGDSSFRLVCRLYEVMDDSPTKYAKLFTFSTATSFFFTCRMNLDCCRLPFLKTWMSQAYQMVRLFVPSDGNHADGISLVFQVIVHLVEFGEDQRAVDDADLFVVGQLEDFAVDFFRVLFFERDDQVAFAESCCFDLLVERVSLVDEEVARK